MHPILAEVGGFRIYTYGAAFGAALFLGVALGVGLGQRRGMEASRLWDVGIAALIGGVVGGRLEYVRTHWRTFAGDPTAIVALRDGGMVFYGGLVVAVIAMVGVARWRRLPVLRMLDAFAPGVPLAHAIGRMGCFAAGCCYGLPTDVPWAVTFPPGSEAPPGVPLHPTQLYEAGWNLLCGVALLAFWRRRPADGRVFGAMLLVYAAFRGANELFRGDAERGVALWGLTNAQVTALALGATGAWLLRRISAPDLAPGTAPKAPTG